MLYKLLQVLYKLLQVLYKLLQVLFKLLQVLYKLLQVQCTLSYYNDYFVFPEVLNKYVGESEANIRLVTKEVRIGILNSVCRQIHVHFPLQEHFL